MEKRGCRNGALGGGVWRRYRETEEETGRKKKLRPMEWERRCQEFELQKL